MTKPNPETLAKLRVRIAILHRFAPEPHKFYYDRIAYRKNGEIFGTCDLPNYPEDLNAVHEAEKLCLAGLELRERFYEYLYGTCEENENCGPAEEGGDDIMIASAFDVTCAEAWQRCIALDRTLSETPIV